MDNPEKEITLEDIKKFLNNNCLSCFHWQQFKRCSCRDNSDLLNCTDWTDIEDTNDELYRTGSTSL